MRWVITDYCLPLTAYFLLITALNGEGIVVAEKENIQSWLQALPGVDQLLRAPG